MGSPMRSKVKGKFPDKMSSAFRKSPSTLLALEPRMMFDGAAVSTALDTFVPLVADIDLLLGPDRSGADWTENFYPLPHFGDGTAPNHTIATETHDSSDPVLGSFMDDVSGSGATMPLLDGAVDTAILSAGDSNSNSIIFIDTNVTGYELLASEWADRGTIIFIDGNRDGIEQMLATLAGREQISSIHIVSHGDDGVFWLGTTRIDQATVQGSLAAAFSSIGSRLSSTGDILIYGCDVGAGEAGQGLVDSLAIATGADVAASLDDTGYIVRGGDWTLENRLGIIESATLTAQYWEGLLAPAIISVSSTTSVLRVYNSAGTLVSDSQTGVGWTGGRSVGVTAGGYAVWSNAGTVGGQAVDLRAVIVSSTSGTSAADVLNFDRPTTTSNDPAFLLTAAAGTGTSSIQVRWELVLAGTNTAVAADINYTIADLDGTGANPNAPTREFVTVATDSLSSFQAAATTDIRFITNVAGQVTAYGTQNEVAAPPLPISAARFNWLNASSWTITYNTVRSASLTAGFSHDGNSEFNLGTGGVTTSIPRLDLDGNDSTTGGSSYRGSFVENGVAARIVDTDPIIVNPVGNVTSATITLTNAQANDQFLVNGSTVATGTLTGGISYTISGNVIQLAGSATASQYQNALQAITFQNISETPVAGDRNINLSFSNGTFSSNIATSTITVIAVNDTPTITAPTSYNGSEDANVTINGLAMADVDAANSSVQLTVSVPAGVGVLNFAATPFITVLNNGTGTVTLQGQRAAILNAVNSGALTLAPTANYNGTSTVTFVFNDRGNAGIDPGLTGNATSEEAQVTATLAIGAVNDAPIAMGNLPSQVNVDAQSGINVATASGFTDIDNATLSYSATGLPAGLSINSATGAITGTIDRSASQGGASGAYTIIVTARDAAGLTATQTFSWTVINPAPVAVNDATLVVDEDIAGTTVNVLANDSDPDGDPLTVISASAANGAVVINANGTFTYTPGPGFNGTDTITYSISDGQGGTATATIPVTINAVNDAPVQIGSLPPQSNVDAQAGISVATAGGFTDVDNTTLSYSATGLPAGLSINAATGIISGTIDHSASQGGTAGVYSIVVTATDSGGLTASQTFSWTVTNPVPTAANDTASTTEDVPIPSINVLGNDADPDGDTLTVISASAPNGTVTINPDGTLRYVPNANFNGADTITYSISDGQGGTATATVAITITAANDAPTAVGSLPAQTHVDATTAINVATASGFADIDNATLSYSATGLPAGLGIDSATGAITGTIDRSASQGGAGGVYSVTVTATDAGGLTATQTFGWTVTNPVPVAVNDLATVAEDTPILIPVLPNDSDPDGDPLTVIAAAASVGTATVVGNQVQYAPPANFNGTATITYTISDGQGGTATATITVTVTPANDAPVSTPITPRNTADGATLAIPVAGNFSDVDGDTLSFAATGLPPGLSIDPVTGMISGTIAANASQTGGGVYTATITVSDGNGGTTSQTITFTVGNPPPVATNDSAATPEDTPVTIPVLANDNDPDGDPLTLTAASALNGTVVINPDGTITYTPNAGFNGADTITYTISDGNGGTTTATVSVSVADVNDTPVTSGTIANQTNLDAQLISLPVAGAFSDPDGDALSYSATGLPAGLTIDLATGVISGTIDRSASQVNGGAYSITVTASDGRGGSISQTFSWTVSNPGPTATNDAAATNEDTPVNIPVLANDTDPDADPLTVTSASAGNGTVAINPDGSLVYTPNANFNGTDTIIYRITDSEGGVSTASVTVTVTPVNDTPTTVGLPNQNGDDGQTISFSVASAFADPDGDPLTFAATGLPPNLTIDPATGLISGTLAPETSQNGPYVVTITATDPSGAQIVTSFVYAVQNVPPIATNDTAATPEDVPVRVAVLTNDSDPDRDPLTITSASANNGTVTINADGTLIFTPNPNFNGVATVSYTISDGNGGIATATLTVNVGAVNDAPTADPIPSLANQDGESASVNVGSFFQDLDGDTLTFSAAGLPPGIGIDPATGILSGTLAANASQTGPYSVTITASDGNGGTVSQTFTWAVTNPAPTSTNDTATTNEDTPVTIPVLANDNDPDSDPLTISSATALNGTVTINPDGTISYTPNANFNGSDTVTYVISDGNGGTSTATVTVTVNPVNDVPVAVADSATTNEDTPVTLNPLANDSDVDGDTLSITSATSPNGTIVLNPDGTITFTPDANFNGPTTITYTISDGNGGTATATIAVNVVAVNDAPVANPSTAATSEDVAVIVPVLANDTDADGDLLTIASASAANGVVTINPDGTVTYTPNANFNGIDTITYTISDGNGGFSTSTVSVTVGGINDAPTVTPIAPQTDNDADVVNLPVAGYFSDLDGDTLSFSASGLPAGLVIDPATGVISGTIDPGASQVAGGLYSVTVTASDGNGGTVSTTFSWTVENPGPTAVNDIATTNEDTPVTISVLANDTDPDADTLSVINASAANGIVTINPDGTVTYTPIVNFNGTDTIIYEISDGQGGTATATVTVTVNAANDAPVVNSPLPNVAGVDGTSANISTAGNFSDLDNDTLSFAAAGLPAGLSINQATGVISGTVDRNASQPNGGIYFVSVTASDGFGGTVSSTFTYTITNPAPTAANDTATVSEDSPVTVAVLANDSDPDNDPLTVISAISPDGVVTINADGTLTFTPSTDFNGPTTITYTISDGNGGTANATVNITVNPVNDAPVLDTPIANQSTVDAEVVSLPVAGNFSDLDNATLSFSATGLPAGLSIDPVTGIISGTIDPAASQLGNGLYAVTVTASDSNGGTVTATFNWIVTNPAPVAVNDTATTDEDTPVTIPVVANDSDPDGDPLRVTAASSPDGTVTINPDGTITFTPNANFNGPTTITYTISDGNGGTATATVAVNVTAINDAPTADPPLSPQSNLDADPITGATSVNVAPNFADLDGDTLSFSATGLPPGLSISAAGLITGTIDSGASLGGVNGLYTVTVTASDGAGGMISSSFTWTVTNPAPLATGDNAATNEDAPVTIAVLSNDSDPDSDPLTVTAAFAANGIVTINPDGTITYTPDANFNGTDTISYTISDGNGGTSEAIVTVNVAPANDAPTTVGLPDLFDSNSEIVTAPAGAAFADLDGNTLAFSATGLPAGLSIDTITGVISGQISSTASAGGPGNNGIYTVTITANDGNGGSVATSFTWTINNQPPLAIDDNYVTNEDTPITIGVLSNDTDPDGNPATPIQIVSASPTNGTAVVNPDGTITFTPDPDFVGTATVTYTISDGLGGFSSAVATIVIAPVNDAPDVTPLPNRSNVDGATISAPVGAFFSDIDGGALTFSAAGLPAGLTIDQATGEIRGIIAANASGINGGLYSVTISADDGAGGVTSVTFLWSVSNPGPVAVDDTATTTEDLPALSIPVLNNDSDPDGDPLTVISASSPNGTVIIGSNGILIYTPDANFNGTDTITYVISDGQGGTSTATVTVTVGAANDAPTAIPLPARSNTDSTAITGPSAVDVSANFVDLDGNTLSFSATGLPLGLSMDSSGFITGTIAPGASQGAPNGIYTVTVTASDGQGGSVVQTFSWTVTNPPPIASDDTASTNEDTPVAIAVLTNDNDPDADPLTVTAASAGNGTVTIGIGGVLTYTPNADFNGTDTITYTISDGNGGTSTATVSIVVAPVNDTPVSVALAPRTNVDGATISVPVAANFSDVDNPTLVFSASGMPAGLSIDPATGLISGIIDRGASQLAGGVYSVNITATDADGLTSSQTFNWTITNPVPVAVNDTAATSEDAPITIAVLANDSDPDTDPLMVTTASASNGTVVIQPDGTISYTPNANFNGVDTITYAISDGNGGTATATVTVTVAPLNDPPVAAFDASSTDEDTPVTIAVLANDSDLDGDPLIVTSATSPDGTVAINPDGTIVFTPNPDFNGVATIFYAISDGQGGSDTATVDVIVRPVNDAPVAVGDSGSTLEDTPITLNPLGNDSDVDGDLLTLTGATSPDGQVTINPDGTITFTPDPNFSGTTTVTYTISDGNGGTATATITLTVTEVNDPPVAVNDNASTREDFPVTIAVLLNDSDADNDPLTVVQAVAGNGIVTINPDGTISYMPNPDFNGVDIITYTISDGRGGFSTATVTIGVGIDNDAPISTPIANQANVDNAPVSLPVAGNFSDVDGDTLSYSTTGLPPGLAIDPTTGIISGTIDRAASQAQGGIYSVAVTVSDGQGGQTTRSFDWTVTNPVPVAANDTASTSEDTPVLITPLSNDNDLDGDPLTITTASAPNGTVVINADGTLTYTPRTDFNGTDTITYTISDGNGGAASATITVTVTAVNDPPVAVNDNASTAEDAPVTIAVLPNDSDRDGDALIVTNAVAANGIVAINPDGSITYTPNPNFNGVDIITYTISDGNGGTAVATVRVGVGLVNDSPVATALPNLANADSSVVSQSIAAAFSDTDGDPLSFSVTGLPPGLTISPEGLISGTIDRAASQANAGVYTVTVTASDGNGGAVSRTFVWTVTNPAPSAANDTATTPEDQPVTIAVLANDSDPDQDPLTITAASSPNGNVVINPDGTLTFTPAPNFNGVALISYTIRDGNGGVANATATVTVSPVNDPPVAANDSSSTNEDTAVRVAVLPNDSDLDGDPLSVVSASAANGVVTINPDGTITYVPNPNFNGIDSVTYTISDGHGGTSTASVLITVNPVNDVPVAANDSVSTPEDQPVNIAVLGNDSDADGDALTVTSASSANGTVSINPDGTITFVPNQDFTGLATITYTISDGQGGSTTATVSITVTPVNDPPVAVNEAASTPEDTPIRVSPLLNDSDVDGDPLTIIAASSPNGTVTINPDGTISFVPDPNFNGPTTITYQVSDGRGGFATATIAVNITPVNDPPVAVNDVFNMDEDTTARIPVLANDTDRDGDPLRVTQASSPNGSVVINADGTISFTPTPDFSGIATITYTITDGNGGVSTAIATVTVRNINELPVDGDERITTIGGVSNVIPVLANATDRDGNPLSVFTASVDVGTITINADGTITYVAPFGYSGPARIIYVISDGQGGFDRSFVFIDVIEAAADMNALLGGPKDPGIPDGWRVDAIRNQGGEFIQMPLIIDQTANNFRSLHPTPMLYSNRPLLDAVNGLSWLQGTVAFDPDGHPIDEVVNYIDRIRDLRFGHDRLFDPRWSDFLVQSLTGFSVRQLNTGTEQVMIESIVRDRVSYMEIRDIGSDEAPRIVEYQLRTRDGSPLPEWIRMDARGLAIIERPVDAEEIHLIVRAIRIDGKIFEIPVVVQGATGEIQLDQALAGKSTAAADTLSKTMAAASAAANNEAAELAAAFSRQA
jgi:large repetitive protein